MSWGPNLFYYRCPRCGWKFKSEEGLIPELGERFGCCPRCGSPGALVKTGARGLDDQEYEDVDE